ncbi:MAG: twitching motility protein PilT, partial [Anaerolineae bacterium]|nr:twitching motility protein PilT [Anaerolineae bacterium]
HEEFRRCAQCGRVYWKGSHYRRMHRLVQEIVRQVGGGPQEGLPSGQGAGK